MNASEHWTVVAKIEDIKEGSGTEFLVGDRIIAVFRLEDQLFAIDGLCPHQGGPLAQGQLANGCVTCPWHGWQFELAGGRHTISGRNLAETFPVRLRDGLVEVMIRSEP